MARIRPGSGAVPNATPGRVPVDYNFYDNTLGAYPPRPDADVVISVGPVGVQPTDADPGRDFHQGIPGY